MKSSCTGITFYTDTQCPARRAFFYISDDSILTLGLMGGRKMIKSVHIYSMGSCNAQSREGFARVLIERNNQKTPLTFHYQDTTSKRSIIQGLIDGALQLDEACHVVLVTSTRLALEKAEIGEGPNRDLIYELYRVLLARGCTYDFEFREGQGAALNKYILSDAS
ncbi:hypothetical protein ACOZB2_21350 [Pantoea endophytica]